MKVYLTPPKTKSKSLNRVVNALIKYKPQHIKIIENLEQSDIIIMHIVGRQDRVKKQIERTQKPYAIIQYCLRSTLKPSTKDWVPIWENANVVWSYLNLKKSCIEDGSPTDFNFYHAPLGSDPNTFYPSKQNRDYVIAISSLSYMTESVREAIVAAQRIRERVFFLGPELKKSNVDCLNDISDSILANRYSQCRFVSGLRRTEGFELPALEGLLCGAKPIFFDRSHYKQWFSKWGIFIHEGTREEVIDNLEIIFKSYSESITKDEIEEVKKKFDWEPIIEGFWNRCLL